MTESLHPHKNEGDSDIVTPLYDDERINPNKLDRHELLEYFFSQCCHPGLRAGEQISDFIVTTLQSGPGDAWGYELQQLKTNSIKTFGEQLEVMRCQDAILGRIYDLIMQTKATVGRNEGISIVRKALFELLDLRVGINAQFDRSQLTSERNESGWNETLNKVVARP